MDVIRCVLRRRAVRVAPAPEGMCCQQPHEKRGPCIPLWGEAAPGQPRTCLAFLHRKREIPKAGTERTEVGSMRRWRWPLPWLGSKHPEKNGSWVKNLWGCFCWKASPQEPIPKGHEEEPPCGLCMDLTTFQEQDMGDSISISSTNISACSQGNNSSSLEAPCILDHEFSSPTETLSHLLEGEDQATEEDLSPEQEEQMEEELLLEDYDDNDDDDDDNDEDKTQRIVMGYLQAGDMTLAQQIRFLHAIPPMCVYSQGIRKDTLKPPEFKAAVVERIVELLEALPVDSGPSSVLSCSLVAMANLSKLRPALERQLESRLLRATMSRILTMDTVKDPYTQVLHKTLEDKLDVMLRSLLAASPSADNLQHTLEHIDIWISSRNTRERIRAMRTSTALLQYASHLPGLDNTSEFSKGGHLVAQLGLALTDPTEDISQLAKDGIDCLYQLLRHQGGLNINDAEELWSKDTSQDRWLLTYINTARVGQVFGKIFSEGQRRSFQKTVLKAAHNPIMCVSEAGLLLAYAIQGEADQLLGDKLEDVLAKMRKQLIALWTLKQMPAVLKSLDTVDSP